MKTLRTLATIVLLFTAVSAFAQIENRQLMKANVPFSFTVENHVLPAGQYSIYTVTQDRSIRVVSADGKSAAIINTLPNYAASPSANSRLVFHKYGNEYFLTQVWTAGQDLVRDPMTSRKETELARGGSSLDSLVVLAFAGQ
jgi:hypothetical protein